MNPSSLPPAELWRLPSGAVVHASGPQDGAATPLLCFHGVGAAAWAWAPQARALQATHPCLVWEGRGHGAAPRVADAGLADYLTDAREALDAAWARHRRPVLLAGHSMGAMLALALAHEQRERVAGLFLVDPVYADAGHRPPALMPLLRLICWAMEPLIASYQRDGWVSRAMTRQIFRSSFHDQAAMAQAWEHQRRVVPMEYPRMFRESILGVAGFPFLPYADLVSVPVCLVEARHRAGARSRYARVVARFQARAGVRCEHVVIDGGHYLQLDRPQAVTQALRAFVGV